MKEYADPTIETLGSIAELTAVIDKCGGSGDSAFPQELSPEKSVECPE